MSQLPPREEQDVPSKPSISNYLQFVLTQTFKEYTKYVKTVKIQSKPAHTKAISGRLQIVPSKGLLLHTHTSYPGGIKPQVETKTTEKKRIFHKIGLYKQNKITEHFSFTLSFLFVCFTVLSKFIHGEIAGAKHPNEINQKNTPDRPSVWVSNFNCPKRSVCFFLVVFWGENFRPDWRIQANIFVLTCSQLWLTSPIWRHLQIVWVLNSACCTLHFWGHCAVAYNSFTCGFSTPNVNIEMLPSGCGSSHHLQEGFLLSMLGKLHKQHIQHIDYTLIIDKTCQYDSTRSKSSTKKFMYNVSASPKKTQHSRMFHQ